MRAGTDQLALVEQRTPSPTRTRPAPNRPAPLVPAPRTPEPDPEPDPGPGEVGGRWRISGRPVAAHAEPAGPGECTGDHGLCATCGGRCLHQPNPEQEQDPEQQDPEQDLDEEIEP